MKCKFYLVAGKKIASAYNGRLRRWKRGRRRVKISRFGSIALLKAVVKLAKISILCLLTLLEIVKVIAKPIFFVIIIPFCKSTPRIALLGRKIVYRDFARVALCRGSVIARSWRSLSRQSLAEEQRAGGCNSLT